MISEIRGFVGVWARRLRGTLAERPVPDRTAPLPVPLAEDLRLPLYLQAEGGRLQLDGEVLRLTVGEQDVAAAPLAEVSEVVLIGPVTVTTPCLHALLRAEVPVSWHSLGGWFLGHTAGLGTGRLAIRLAQYRASQDGGHTLAIARTLVAAKIWGSRLMIRRNHKGHLPPRLALCRLERMEFDAERAESIGELLGIEGAAGAVYFDQLKQLLSAGRGDAFAAAFAGRRRRPPTDPLNAALSFSYAMLARAVTVAVTTSGFDPQLGFLHRPRAGRPALALDLMEPLRPLVADSAVLTAINNGRLQPEHFSFGDDAVLLDGEGRRRVIAAFEQRLTHAVEHPAFARSLTYREWFAAQARLLGDFLTGARPDFPQLRPR